MCSQFELRHHNSRVDCVRWHSVDDSQWLDEGLRLQSRRVSFDKYTAKSYFRADVEYLLIPACVYVAGRIYIIVFFSGTYPLGFLSSLFDANSPVTETELFLMKKKELPSSLLFLFTLFFFTIHFFPFPSYKYFFVFLHHF